MVEIGKKNFTFLAMIATTVFSSLFLFTSCGKKQQSYSEKKSGTKQNSKDFVGAAKRIDTPTPVGFSLLENTTTTTASRFSYTGMLSQEKTYHFYRKEMERLGWALIDLSSSEEQLLFCHKTTKYCAVRISKNISKKQPTAVTLYLKELSRQEEQSSLLGASL